MVAPCKFARKCTRANCFFEHPQGREMDEQAAVLGSLGSLRVSAPQASTPQGAGRPHERPGAAPCKFNFACTRPDCFFAHPGGRAIDATPARHAPQQPHPTLGVPADPQLQNNINLPDSPFGVVEEQELENMLEEQERAADKDTWFPAHRDCACCRGYVHACVAPMCLELGVCGCTLGDSDILAAGDEEQ